MGLNCIFTYPKFKSVYNGWLEKDLTVMLRNFYVLIIVLYMDQEEEDGNAS